MTVGDWTDNSNTWTGWNVTYTTSSATTSGTAETTWTLWNGTSSAATDTSVTWSGWCSNGTVTVSGWQPRELTPEERAAETERLRVAAEEARARHEEARLACEKAEALLRAHLDDEQRASLDRDKAFLVSVTSGRKYRVKRGQRGNVQELDAAGQPVRQFCIHPDDVPDGDAMLAQKLLLEHDEAAFRRIANVTELRRTA